MFYECDGTVDEKVKLFWGFEMPLCAMAGVQHLDGYLPHAQMTLIHHGEWRDYFSGTALCPLFSMKRQSVAKIRPCLH